MRQFLILILIYTNLAMADETTTPSKKISINDEKGQLNDKFDIEFVLASEQTKDIHSHETNGVYSSLKSSFLYSLTDKHQFRLFTSHVHEAISNDENEFYSELGEIMYRRKNILNQEQHWVDLDLELKNYWVLDSSLRQRWGFDGAFIPQLIIRRTFSQKAGVTLKVRRHFYDRNRITSNTITKEDRIYLTPHYLFKRKFMATVELKYRHKMYVGDHFSFRTFSEQAANQEITTLRPSLAYFPNRKVMLELYTQAELAKSGDNRNLGKMVRDEQIFGAGLYLTLL